MTEITQWLNNMSFWHFILLGTPTIWVVLLVIKMLVVSRLESLTNKTKVDFDDVFVQILQQWNAVALLAISIWSSISLAIPSTEIHTKVIEFSNTAIIVVIAWFVTQSLQSVVTYGFSKYLHFKKRSEPEYDVTIVMFLKRAVRILIWVLAGLFVAQNLGYRVTALMGGLGLGGLAVAFAVQSVLGDIFSSLSIHFDKPFQIGDFIVFDDKSGIVQKIGLRSTRLQTLQGEELIVPNQDITSTRVHNYKRMHQRRVVLKLGVAYETKQTQLKKIPKMIQKVVEAQENATFQRAHFINFGDSSLDFEVVYLVETAEYEVYLDIQQAVGFELLKVFEKNGIEFAYPTRTIYSKSI